jgi:hypothetical protein
MSVDYRAIYGYGFIVTDADLQNLSAEDYEKFLDSEYHICVDCYRDNNYHFFGLVLSEAEPGEVNVLPAVDNYEHEDFIKMNSSFRRMFPIQKFHLRHYLIHQIC